MVASGIAFGLNKGHVTEKRKLPERPSRRKGRQSVHVNFVRGVVREIAGFAPYERRIMELLKIGHDKRALKLAKRRVCLGSFYFGLQCCLVKLKIII